MVGPLLCNFIYLKHIDYNKMSKYIQKVERWSFLISRSVKCVTRTGNLLLLISSLILRCFAKKFHLLYIFIYLKHIDYNKMSKYIQKVERCSFLSSRSVKRFPVRDISVNFRFGFGFGLHFLPTTVNTPETHGHEIARMAE